VTTTEAIDLLTGKDDILILTHQRPDGDTMGSAAALCCALRALGKTAYLYDNPQFADSQPWITEGYLAPEGFSGSFVVAVDTADKTLFPLGYSGGAELCIDHHPSNTRYAENTVLDSAKASCGEIMMEIVKGLNGGLSKTAADLLYIAVSTDTGCFVYGNTTGDTLRAAAELCDAGASNTALNKLLFRTSTKARLELESLMYSSFRYYNGGYTVVSIVTDEMMEKAGATESDCTDLASVPGRVQNSATTVLIRETDESLSQVSIRTNGAVNASEVCKAFGGGGHLMAAGCNVRAGVYEAEKLILAAIDEDLK
jgi:phosphoesterase RecJ-like protein